MEPTSRLRALTTAVKALAHTTVVVGCSIAGALAARLLLMVVGVSVPEASMVVAATSGAGASASLSLLRRSRHS